MTLSPAVDTSHPGAFVGSKVRLKVLQPYLFIALREFSSVPWWHNYGSCKLLGQYGYVLTPSREKNTTLEGVWSFLQEANHMGVLFHMLLVTFYSCVF